MGSWLVCFCIKGIGFSFGGTEERDLFVWSGDESFGGIILRARPWFCSSVETVNESVGGAEPIVSGRVLFVASVEGGTAVRTFEAPVGEG